MLVINSADDYFIPQSDTLIFQGRKAPEVVPTIIARLAGQFA